MKEPKLVVRPTPAFRATVAKTSAIASVRDALIVPIRPGATAVPKAFAAYDRSIDGSIARLLASGDVRGRPGELHSLHPSGDGGPKRVLVVGIGDTDAAHDAVRRAAGAVGRRCRELGLRTATVALPGDVERDGVETNAEAFVRGFFLGAYRAPVYRAGRAAPIAVPSLRVVPATAARATATRTGVALGVAIAEGAWRARELINRPANDVTPLELARTARAMCRQKGLTCRVRRAPELEKMGAGGLIAVGKGSVNPPCLIEMRYTPAKGAKGAPTWWIVGKGITFDTGGVNVKSAAGMRNMKYDMGGSAAVVGVMSAVATLGLPIRVVGLIAAAENMPSAAAYKPGDVITQLDGTTVEVVNTDAEGRIVLGDALAHASSKAPDVIVDVATLTGACSIALGSDAIALMSNDDDVSARLDRAGQTSGERVWRLPLWRSYRRLMKSDVADLKNSGGREAATITAAVFLERFVGERAWAHLDIAGTAWSDRDAGFASRGGVGVGVALLTVALRDAARG